MQLTKLAAAQLSSAGYFSFFSRRVVLYRKKQLQQEFLRQIYLSEIGLTRRLKEQLWITALR